MKGKRRFFAAVLTLCLVLTGMPGAAFGADTAAAGDIVILYSSDMHGGVDSNLGLAGLAALANEKRAQGDYVELVDAGDAVSGTTLASTTQGKYVIEAMNLAGYGIAVPGVHDFDYGVSGLVGTLSKEANHQYVSCNFTMTANGQTVFKPYVIKTYGSAKVAYIGISDPQTISKSGASFKNSDGSAAYSFADGAEGKNLYHTVQAAINEAKAAGADYIVAIGHLSMTGDAAYTPKSVIENTTGIQAFIDGNTHTATVGEKVKTADGSEALLTCAGAGLSNLGVLTITAGKRITSQLINSYNLRDIKTKDGIDALTKKYRENLQENFAATSSRLEAANSSGVRIIEGSETNLGDLCADAYRVVTGADIAFVEAREIKSNIELGTISYDDIMSALPGGQSISVISVSGYDILDALEMSARVYPAKHSGFLQVSGITFDIQETVIPSVTLDGNGNFIGVSDDYRVTNVMINGKELDVMANYTVAGTNALLNGETGYTMLRNGPIKKANVTTDNQALITYIAASLKNSIGGAYSRSQGRIDSIKLARQSEIDAEIEKKVEERIKDYVSELKTLRAQLAAQQDIVAIKSLSIKTAAKFSKSGSKRTVRVTWTPSEKISGVKYQLYKSTKKSSGYKKLAVASGTTFRNTSSLSKNKTYYYKVRAYQYIKGKYYYSSWSNAASCKVRK